MYPEGTARSGPAALQPGDRSFRSGYDVITGTVTTDGLGVLGASVSATDRFAGETRFEGFSGKARFRFDPATGGFFFTDTIEQAVVDADYEIPVFRRRFYDLQLQAGDGDPAGSNQVSLTGVTGFTFGQQNFAEEFLGFGRLEDDDEILPGLSFPRFSSRRGSADFVTNSDELLRNAGPLDFIGTGAAIGDGVTYAERFTNADVMALINAGSSPTTGLYRTWVSDASTVPLFQRASLQVGRVNDDGTATLEDILRDEEVFVAQQDDLSPHYYKFPLLLKLQLWKALSADPTLDVFVVLEPVEGLVLGDSALPPLVGLSVTDVDPTSSFLAINGSPLAPRASNWAIEMRFTPIDDSTEVGFSLIP